MKTVLVKVGVKPSLEWVQGWTGDKDMESASIRLACVRHSCSGSVAIKELRNKASGEECQG